MFEGIRDVLNKANKPVESTVLNGKLFPILTAPELLATERRQQFLKALPGLSQLPNKEYQANYLKVINNFAEFVQSLPQTMDGYFNYSGGLLDHGLERAVRALTLSRSYIANQTGDPKEITRKQALLRYAVFTAALLFDVGLIATKFLIDICDAQGKILKRWHPYQRTMIGLGSHYKFEFDKQNWDYLRKKVTPMLARQLMEINGSEILQGFNWLSSDNEILETWFAMLKEDSRQMSSLLTVIPLADAQTIANYFDLDRPMQENFVQPTAGFWDNYSQLINQFANEAVDVASPALTATQIEALKQLSPEERSRIEATLASNIIEAEKVTGTPNQSRVGEMTAPILERRVPLVPPTHAAGLAFMRWLLRGVNGRTLSVNRADSFLHRIEKGILLKNEIFEHFAKTQTQYKDAAQVRKQFSEFGFSTKDNKAGMVIKNPYLIFLSGKLPEINKNFSNNSVRIAADFTTKRPTKF